MSDDELLVSVEEAARRLGIGRSMMYELLRRAEVPSVKLGKRRLVPTSALKDLAGRLVSEAL